MDLIQNENLKQWINETYPLMQFDIESDLFELDFYDMDKFSEWLEKKIYTETIKKFLNNLDPNNK